jgi:glyoxylase-like metal-dependent hydrolase (beta-lactamase superfamily II)
VTVCTRSSPRAPAGERLNALVDELRNGILRITFPLPLGIDHVHCYLLPGEDGWTLVDTGLGLPGAEQRWAQLLGELDGRVARIVITHFHPDHVGGGELVQRLTGAPVLQGAHDYSLCERVWGNARWSDRLADYLRANGLPEALADELREESRTLTPLIRFARNPEPIAEGDDVGGWRVLELPGHADGHICLLRGDVLVAGDHLLAEITPTVGLYPESRPDPLGDFLASLERTIGLAPSHALTGHNEPLDDPVLRAREIIQHHRVRLDETVAALAAGARNGYEVSLELFDTNLDASGRRFALTESLAHLERLVREGRARRARDGVTVSYTET